MEMPSYDLIVAAVGGDPEAMEKILRIYTPLIEEECHGDEDMRQEITLALMEAILHYDLNDPEKNREYLRKQLPRDTEI